MNLVVELIGSIFRNKYFWRLIFLTIAFGFVVKFGVPLIKREESKLILFIFYISVLLFIIYAFVIFLRVVYDITKLNDFSREISFEKFFWLLFYFNLVFNILVLTPGYIIYFAFIEPNIGISRKLGSILTSPLIRLVNLVYLLLYTYCLVIVVYQRSWNFQIRNLIELMTNSEFRAYSYFLMGIGLLNFIIDGYFTTDNAYKYLIIIFMNLIYFFTALMLTKKLQRDDRKRV